MAIRHDRPLLATLMVQPISFLVILGIAVSFTPRNVPWVVLDRSDTAASRRLVQEVAGERLLPARRAGRELRRGHRRACSSGQRRRLARHRPRLRPRRSSGAGPRCRSCSTAPIRSPRRASAASSPRSPPLSSRAATAAGRAPTPQLARAGPIDVRQRFWFNPTLDDSEFFLVGARRHAAHQSVLLGDRAGAGRRARERHLRADAGAARPARSRSCSASCCPTSGSATCRC